MSKKKLSTLALHAGYDYSKSLKSRAVPIYATTSFVFDSAQNGADLFAGKAEGFIYSRIHNPTTTVLEERLSAYHGGSAAMAVASGCASNALLFLGLADSGKKIVSSPHLYGSTFSFLSHNLKKFGVAVEFVDVNDEKALRAAIDKNTLMVYAESVGNPSGYILDIEKVSKISHGYNIPLVVDNTVTPPPLLNPFEYGADILTYSLTKLIGGHGTHIGGMIIEKGDFDWGANPVFTNYINAPDPTAEGTNFWEVYGKPFYKEGKSAVLINKLRGDVLRGIGATLSPFGGHEFLKGLETLNLRAIRQSESAKIIAEYLSKHHKIGWVHYSGLKDSPFYDLSQKYFPKTGPGAVFSFGLKGGYEAGVKFIDNLEVFSNLANILDARSLVIHPASTTHSQLKGKALLSAGVTEDLVRFSIGLEDVDDLIEAIDKALSII
ncbi:MAG: aminotransferase class I/II-fold pyridoxal phosphate-dependent enzyme [Endomicrobium sp.]|jgi:O-acetylhomoserine (thiol)-lyase|nr:aminotransferase class I/II-fold pyridoxal phosphate-dependent enzyme [Endomicrobium sp.]